MSLRSLPALFCLTRPRTAGPGPGGQGQPAPPRASATSLRPRPATTRTTATLGLIALLAGCASTPPPGERDGPPLKVPAELNRTPDAQPRVEPIRAGGPNKPYEALGRRYVPFTDDRPLVEHGLASWYGRKFHGRPTSNGEPYDMFAMTAAHKTMPIPSYARVRNPANGREIIVRVNDRGPFVDGRIIDLSYVAALRLGVLNNVAPVQVRRLTTEEIRSLQGSAERARALLDP
jgi:rare lipoprotein A